MAWYTRGSTTSAGDRSTRFSLNRGSDRLRASGVRILPVELSRLAVARSGLQRALADAHRRHQLGIVAGREDFVRDLEILVAHRGLDHAGAGRAQERDHPLPRDAVEEGAVRGRREHHAVLGHEDVGSRELRDIAEEIAEDAIVEAALLRLDE